MQRFTQINQEIFPNLCSRMPQNILIFLENLYKKIPLFTLFSNKKTALNIGTSLYLKNFSKSRYDNRKLFIPLNHIINISSKCRTNRFICRFRKQSQCLVTVIIHHLFRISDTSLLLHIIYKAGNFLLRST